MYFVREKKIVFENQNEILKSKPILDCFISMGKITTNTVSH